MSPLRNAPSDETKPAPSKIGACPGTRVFRSPRGRRRGLPGHPTRPFHFSTAAFCPHRNKPTASRARRPENASATGPEAWALGSSHPSFSLFHGGLPSAPDRNKPTASQARRPGAASVLLATVLETRGRLPQPPFSWQRAESERRGHGSRDPTGVGLQVSKVGSGRPGRARSCLIRRAEPTWRCANPTSRPRRLSRACTSRDRGGPAPDRPPPPRRGAACGACPAGSA